MKPKEIRKKTKEECIRILREKGNKLREFCFSAATARPKNTKQAFNLRKDVARIKTILKEYEK